MRKCSSTFSQESRKNEKPSKMFDVLANTRRRIAKWKPRRARDSEPAHKRRDAFSYLLMMKEFLDVDKWTFIGMCTFLFKLYLFFFEFNSGQIRNSMTISLVRSSCAKHQQYKDVVSSEPTFELPPFWFPRSQRTNCNKIENIGNKNVAFSNREHELFPFLV